MRGLVFMSLLLLALAWPAWGDMNYECTDGHGGWLWQSTPCPPGQARPGPVSQDKRDFCQSFALVVHVVALSRDKGISLNDMLAAVRENPPDSPRHILAVNKDVVRSVYAQPETNPATIALRSFSACLSE